MKIGVFDSGIGGKSVATAIAAAFPNDEVVFKHDSADHFPYASKSPDEIYGFAEPVFQSLIKEGCSVIVVACNTVSTTLIGRLRAHFTEVPLVALEPMVKPAAAQTKSGVIAVCATPTTLKSDRYAWLKQTYAPNITIIEPDCADWSYLIEYNHMNEARLRQEIEPAMAAGADVIVLGCTHYHWIEAEMKQIADGRAIVLQPEQAVIAKLKHVVQSLL